MKKTKFNTKGIFLGGRGWPHKLVLNEMLTTENLILETRPYIYEVPIQVFILLYEVPRSSVYSSFGT